MEPPGFDDFTFETAVEMWKKIEFGLSGVIARGKMTIIGKIDGIAIRRLFARAARFDRLIAPVRFHRCRP